MAALGETTLTQSGLCYPLVGMSQHVLRVQTPILELTANGLHSSLGVFFYVCKVITASAGMEAENILCVDYVVISGLIGALSQRNEVISVTLTYPSVTGVLQNISGKIPPKALSFW